MRVPAKLMAVSTAILAASIMSASAYEVVGEMTGVDGSVLIERDGVLLTATDASGLLSGDTITVTGDSEANLVFFEGCEGTLTSSTTMTIGDENFCDSFTRVAQVGEGLAGSTLIGGTAVPTAILVGAGVIGVTTIVVVASDDDSPSSP